MKKRYCCDASKDLFEKYFIQQQPTGGGLNASFPVFAGRRTQRGHGFLSTLGGWFGKLIPFIKTGLSALGKQALRTGVDVAQDYLQGSNVKESAKRHIPEGIKRFATEQGFINQTGSGSRGRSRTTKRGRSKSTGRSKSVKKRKKKKLQDS